MKGGWVPCKFPSFPPIQHFVCSDVCVCTFLHWLGTPGSGYHLLCFSFFTSSSVKGFSLSTSHLLVFVLFGFWFYLHSSNISRVDLCHNATVVAYLDDLDDVGGETLLLLLLSLWLLLLLVRLPQVAVIAAMLIAFVVVAIMIGVVAVTVARLAATASTVLPTLVTMLLLMFMWLLLAPAALFNKLLLKNS